MRILIPCHFPLEGSGSGVYVLNVARELLRRGHDVLIVAPAHPAHGDMSLPIREIVFAQDDPGAGVPFEFPSFTTHPASRQTFQAMSQEQMDVYVGAYRAHIEQAVRELTPDLIHAQHLWVGASCAVETGRPVVVTAHGTELMGFRDCPLFRDPALIAAQRSAAVIAVSHEVERSLRLLFRLPSGRVHVIHNGVDAELFYPRTASLPETLRGLGVPVLGTRGLTFVGKLTWFKGPDLLIRAAEVYEQDAPDLMTLVVGSGSLLGDLQALAEGLGLKRVAFVGELPHRRIPDVLSAGDLTCVPSRGEPFSLVALESMACGTPVVGFRSGGLPEFLTPERGVIVDEFSPAALADAILGELAADAKANKGPAAAAFARRERSWGRVVDDTFLVYEQALAPS